MPIYIFRMQKKPDDYADVPIVLALAWYLNVDILILDPNLDQPQLILGSMMERSTSPRPPLILGYEISDFCLISFSQNEKTYICSVCILFEESEFVFQFLNNKIEKHTYFPQKVYKPSKAKFSHFERTQEEAKTRYFAP